MFLEQCGWRTETKAARQDISASTDKTEQPNKAIKEHLSFAHDCFTAKFHLSLYILLSPSVSPFLLVHPLPPSFLVSSALLLLSGLPTLREERRSPRAGVSDWY